MQKAPRSLKGQRWFFIVWTSMSVLITVIAGTLLWEDVHGGDTTATVRQVPEYLDGTGTKLVIVYQIPNGTECTSSTHLAGDELHAGDTIRVHYSRRYPCGNVRRTDGGATNPTFLFIIPVIFLASGVFQLVRVSRELRRQAQPAP